MNRTATLTDLLYEAAQSQAYLASQLSGEEAEHSASAAFTLTHAVVMARDNLIDREGDE